MGQPGRPPIPLEQKRKHGRTSTTDSGGRRLPSAEVVTVLPMANGVPDPPAEFGLEARGLWASAWNAAITWLSPMSDMRSVVDACHLADDLAVARRRYRATSAPADARALVALQKAMTDALSALGFNPTARTRLGVAEVKRVSALEQLAQQRRG